MDNERAEFLNDLSTKQKHILKLHEKVNDLEDMNFKLTNFNKDKKKFYAMEMQTKGLTNAIQQVSILFNSFRLRMKMIILRQRYIVRMKI